MIMIWLWSFLEFLLINKQIQAVITVWYIVPICFSNPICTEVTIVCMYPPAKDIKLVSKKTFRNSDESWLSLMAKSRSDFINSKPGATIASSFTLSTKIQSSSCNRRQLEAHFPMITVTMTSMVRMDPPTTNSLQLVNHSKDYILGLENTTNTDLLLQPLEGPAILNLTHWMGSCEIWGKPPVRASLVLFWVWPSTTRFVETGWSCGLSQRTPPVSDRWFWMFTFPWQFTRQVVMVLFCFNLFVHFQIILNSFVFSLEFI